MTGVAKEDTLSLPGISHITDTIIAGENWLGNPDAADVVQFLPGVESFVRFAVIALGMEWRYHKKVEGCQIYVAYAFKV